MLGWLMRQLTRVPKQRPDLAFVLYHRAGCHLCDIAWDQLLQAQRRHSFLLEKKDINDDPRLVAAYGECVPVVAVNGEVRFRGQVNGVLLQRLLDAGV